MDEKPKSYKLGRPRDVMFYQMTTIEILQVLVEGKMPNGLVIDDATRACSLVRLIPMVKDMYSIDPNFKSILECNKDWYLEMIECVEELIKQGEAFLKSKGVDYA